MAKRNAWGEAIKQQDEPKEKKKEYGRCRCGHGGFSLSLVEHDIVRTCKQCKAQYNVDKGMYI